ncbi:phenylacetic acid degradation operon negative regulatory protein PaaX [Motiliproteus sp. SC1-56]|uniref:phenylacetic acid degradation operon negative regulatory protein PaaX n=1 Tax=Motiliproteus sp. SC1-56 TaxID=2799565 RepID=UPI001A8D4514|nr:phenylacetic acid degradation operon negative regulatory protein PaaX [Motiliproteus sp. SC1-56]
MTFQTLEHLIEAFRQRRPIRAGSLIITVYGDAIAPRGGTVWLGSLIKLLAPLGLNERLVRTSVFRLVKDRWLSVEPVGRRSNYSLTDSGRRRFEKAGKRIYAERNPAWDGRWTLALLNQLSPEQRQEMRQELTWQGFGSLSSTAMLHPQIPPSEMRAILQEYAYQDEVIVLDQLAEDSTTTRAMRRQVRESWDLDRLSQSYRHFLEQYTPLGQEIERLGAPPPAESFLLRTLMMHEYRRIMLRDPELPEALLPDHWEGKAARELAANIYQGIWRATERHLETVLECAGAELPAPDRHFYQRYGGLP